MRRFVVLATLITATHEVFAFPLIKPRSEQAVRASTRITFLSSTTSDVDQSDQYRDYILDFVVQKQASQPITRQWQAGRRFLWFRYGGTVLQTALLPSIASAVASLVVCIALKEINVLPGVGLPFSDDATLSLGRLSNLWHMDLTVVSFFLAFFLNTAKSFYESILGASRSVQGRLNDMNLIAASHACRDADGEMTSESKETVDTLGRYISLFSIFFYSCHCRRYKCLLDDKGLEGLTTRGLLTEEEMELLKGVNPQSRSHSVLNWMVSTFTRGCESDKPCFRMQSNCHLVFIQKAADLRSSSGTITDLLDARCPLAYVHFIQLLVDSFLIVTPFAAVSDMGWLAPFGSFLLCLFFAGLLDLSKVLFDPLDNEDYGAESDNIQTDVLIQESNGGSQRYLTTGLQFPFGARHSSR